MLLRIRLDPIQEVESVLEETGRKPKEVGEFQEECKNENAVCKPFSYKRNQMKRLPRKTNNNASLKEIQTSLKHLSLAGSSEGGKSPGCSQILG
mmetsp:Transcript_4895/g.5778  ORF Transcript_4895/g.5778 Transcript_4895/m.5778 type:complete len:94 (+) Transcript_4895:309-590(+)